MLSNSNLVYHDWTFVISIPKKHPKRSPQKNILENTIFIEKIKVNEIRISFVEESLSPEADILWHLYMLQARGSLKTTIADLSGDFAVTILPYAFLFFL